MSAIEENKIILTLLNGTGYVFDVDDYMQLRSEHRIVGSLVGTCSTRGWSANQSMLPAELSLCETQLLVELGIALLVSKKQSLLAAPNEDELAAYKDTFERRITEQANALKSEKLRETDRNMDKVLAGKRQKLLTAGVPTEDIHLDAESILKEISDTLVFDRKNALLEITLAQTTKHTAEIIRLPADKSLNYRVFRDFWFRGKFITSGEAFGADFLIYPGDPLLFHASHIVILLPDPQMQPLAMISKVRLSVTVNKVCIFAYFGCIKKEAKTKLGTEINKEGVIKIDMDEEDEDREEPPLCYQTVAWEGNRCKEE